VLLNLYVKSYLKEKFSSLKEAIVFIFALKKERMITQSLVLEYLIVERFRVFIDEY
jgi:hypothetical protein